MCAIMLQAQYTRERELPHIQPERLIQGHTCSPEAPGPGIELACTDVDAQCIHAGMAAGATRRQLPEGHRCTDRALRTYAMRYDMIGATQTKSYLDAQSCKTTGTMSALRASAGEAWIAALMLCSASALLCWSSHAEYCALPPLSLSARVSECAGDSSGARLARQRSSEQLRVGSLSTTAPIFLDRKYEIFSREFRKNSGSNCMQTSPMFICVRYT